MIRDATAFLGDERFVGRKLDELLYPPEVNVERRKYPDASSLNIAPEMIVGREEWQWD